MTVRLGFLANITHAPALIAVKNGYFTVSGVATGGASIVVKPSVRGAAQLKGQSLATPSLGNTQD